MRTSTILLSSILVMLTGCELFDKRQPTLMTPPALKAATAEPVQPADITAANAKAKAQQFEAELEQEANFMDRAGSQPR